MSRSDDAFWDFVAVMLIIIACLVGGLAIGHGASNESWEALVVKRGYAHYDGVTRKFTWNDAEKAEVK